MDASALTFADNWLWLIFVGIGLFFIILELLIGVDTGLDLVFVGSTFVLGGLVTWPFGLWPVTLIVTVLICIAYVVLGRRYVHRWTAVKLQKSNIDLVIGSTGIVLEDIRRNEIGRVRVRNERWRASAEEDIPEGFEVIVTGISGNTLSVKKSEGGNK